MLDIQSFRKRQPEHLKSFHSYYALLAVIFVVALGLRVSLAAVFQGLGAPPNFSAQPDQIDYEQLAFHLSTGNGYTNAARLPTAFRPPGTSFTLFPVYAAVGRSFTAGRLWFCVLSAITCLAVAWLASQCYGQTVGLLSAAWLAIYPGHFYYSMHFVSEVPYALWLTLACGCTVRALNGGKRVSGFDVAAGVFLGLTALTRPQIALIVPIAGVLVMLTSRSMRRKSAGHLIVQTCVFSVVLLPWVARNAVVMGKPTLSTVGAYTFWGAHNDTVANTPALRGSWVPPSDLVDEDHPFRGTELEREAAAWRYGFDFISHHPRRIPGLITMKIWRLLSPFDETSNYVVYWVFAAGWVLTVPWVITGMIAAFKRDRLSATVMLTPLLATVAMTIVFYGSVRFRDSAAPILIVFAARGFGELVPGLFLAAVGDKVACQRRTLQTD